MEPRRACLAVGAGAVVFFLVGLILVRFSTESGDAGISVVFVLLLALPAYAGYTSWLGLRRAFPLLLLLSFLPLGVEALAVVTGIPYGRFSYGDMLGWKLVGLVPLTVAFAYPPLLLGAVALAYRLTGPDPRKLIPAATGFLVAMDLIIDPAAVHAGFWSWEEYGLYYGIPPINFVGWILTGAVYTTILWLGIRKSIIRDGPDPIAGMSSMILILSFWTGYLLREGLAIPAGAGFLILLGSAVIMTKAGFGKRQ
jgi:putative membrane protein